MTPEDVEAIVRQLAAASPGPLETVASAFDMLKQLREVRRTLTVLIPEWEKMLAQGVLEAGGTVDMGAVVLRNKPKWEERFDHELIGRRVATEAQRIVQPDGEIIEIDDPKVVAERTVALMQALYVAPASTVKKTALREDLRMETYKAALASRTRVGTTTEVRAK